MKKGKIILILILIITIFFIIKLLLPSDTLDTYIKDTQTNIINGTLNDGTIIYLNEIEHSSKYNKCNSDSFVIVYRDRVEKYIQCDDNNDFIFIDLDEVGDKNELKKFGVYTINNKTIAYSKYNKHINLDGSENNYYPTIKLNGLNIFDIIFNFFTFNMLYFSYTKNKKSFRRILQKLIVIHIHLQTNINVLSHHRIHRTR